MRQLLVNERIRINKVRVIGEDGAQLGVMSPAEGIQLAREKGFDLVCVSPQTTPPVCRIMDFPRFRYEEERREREGKKKHHVSKLKEVKFRPRIEEHDYQVKLNMLKRFLIRGDKSKVTLVYRGRELAHKELGTRVLARIVVDLKTIGKVERQPFLEGRFMTMVFTPDRDGIRRVAKQAAAQQPPPPKGLVEGQASSASQPASRRQAKKTRRSEARTEGS